ncbi:hypothetical protein U9M48_041665 [Paspalum notatum var. saurae]|uniref:Dirigent protein n=1 Tax=Paspalum notatum var. saurae TaxID=547442 RepID=A0AAQ3XEE8_PASNO
MAAARCPWLVLTTMLLVLMACSGSGAAEELTHLSFYFHEVPSSAPNATIATVASLNVYVTTGSTFGDLQVFDNALREGADPSSTLIGRARGMVVAASLDNSGRVSIIEFVFSNFGDYSGSTLASLGHLTIPDVTERSIVGGTGVLRFARGYFTTQVISSTSDLGVALFDVYFTTQNSDRTSTLARS